VKQPNQPWPGAAEAIAEARGALVAAGVDVTAAVDSPAALAGTSVAVRVPVGDGHFIVTALRWGDSGEPRWTSGLAAWRPLVGTRGAPSAEAVPAGSAIEAIARSMVRALGQDWATEEERAMMHGMLARLRAAEVRT
jgi:hypothetical protein